MSYLRYLSLFADSDVQHILCCAFVFAFVRLMYLVLSISLDCPFLIDFRYSLTFIFRHFGIICNR
jgi:hypothetical protein